MKLAAVNRPAVVSILLVIVFLGFLSPRVAGQTRRSTRIQGKDYVSINDAALLLGATKFWKAETKKVALNVGGKRVRFTVGSPIVAVGDRTFVLRAPVLFVRGVAYVPVDFFSEVVPQVLEKRVAWSADSQTLSSVREGTMPEALPGTEDTAPPGGEVSRGAYRVVVIDPGHGGSDEGVKGKSGAVEKQTTLEIARDVKEILSKSGTLEVVLTRDDDSDETPEARATRANAAHGDIFVSIHCDGYASPRASGFCVEVYRAPDGFGTAVSEPAIGGVRLSSWKDAPVRHARTSLSLARVISDRLSSATGLKEMGMRRVPALALEGVDMPSTLVCCGFLTNPGDEAFLLDPSSRHKIAVAVADGVREFVGQAPR